LNLKLWVEQVSRIRFRESLIPKEKGGRSGELGNNPLTMKTALDFPKGVRAPSLLLLQLDVGALLSSANCLLSAAGKESLDQNDIGIAIADRSE
jgi:hypothetical protein